MDTVLLQMTQFIYWHYKKTETELDLAKDTYSYNITLSLEHSNNAARLVADTFYTDEDVANDNEFIQRYNK